MAGSRPESTGRPQSTGPVPPGTPPAAATPDGGPTAAGPSPTGHPSTAPSPSGDVAEAEAAVEKDIDVARIARERDDYLDALKRLQADFENYKKRILKQQTEHLERAAESLVEKLLPVLDTFDLARAHGGGDDVRQIATTLVTTLEREGLERIDPGGGPFDPTLHEA